jgi:hypothetical protein
MALGFALACNERGGFEGTPKEESVHIDLDKVEMVTAEFRQAAGEMEVEGGSQKLLEARFRYRDPSWKPKVQYSSSGFRGRLSVEQQASKSAHGGQNSEWKLRLNETVPIDIKVHAGATEAKLNLASLNLRGVEVHAGVGQITVDLRGQPVRDYNVDIRGGVGQATVYLPKRVNVIAQAHGGIGTINVSGLSKDGDRWVRRVSEIGVPTVRVDVRGGIGEIRLVGE